MCQCVFLSFLSLSGLLLPSLQHVWCVAINKMAALSAMWQAIELHIWDFGSRMVIKSAVSLGGRVFLTGLLNVAQQLCSHRGNLRPHLLFLQLQKENGYRSSEARTLASPMYYLSGIAQALIEHADLAFSLSPNNHYDLKSEMASLHTDRIPSRQWLRHVYLYIHLWVRARKHTKHLHSHLHAYPPALCMSARRRVCFAEHTWGKGLAVEALKVV